MGNLTPPYYTNPIKDKDMKKIIIIAIMTLAVTLAANAQPKAIGGRLGYGLEASYQHNVGQNANFMEIDLGLGFVGGLQLNGAYNFMIAQPEWTTKGEWGFYAGPSVGAAYLWYVNGGSITVGGQLGLEYTFDFPLQLSVDIRPQIGALFYSGYAGFYMGGLFGFIPCLSVRYRFGK